jgi:ATP-dependent DNA ligase
MSAYAFGFGSVHAFRPAPRSCWQAAASSFVIDGEDVVLDNDRNSDFDRLHSRRHDDEVQLLGFDLLELDAVSRSSTKAALVKLLRRSRDGIQYVEQPKCTLLT